MPSGTVNLHKSYAKVNSSITKLFDESGVRRSFTIPYSSQDMSDHIAAVGQIAQDSGGLSGNLILSGHNPDGAGFGSDEGETSGYPVSKLSTTLIPKDDPNAAAALKDAQKHISNMESLLGKDNPVIQTAQGQLNLAKKTQGQGMNLLDFGTMLTQIMYRPTQAIAKLHNATKGKGSVQGSSPEDQQEQPGGEEQAAPGEEQGGEAQPQAENAAPQQADNAQAPQQEQAPAPAQG